MIYLKHKHHHAMPLFKNLNCFLLVVHRIKSKLLATAGRPSVISPWLTPQPLLWGLLLRWHALTTPRTCGSPATQLFRAGASAGRVPYASLGSPLLFVSSTQALLCPEWLSCCLPDSDTVLGLFSLTLYTDTIVVRTIWCQKYLFTCLSPLKAHRLMEHRDYVLCVPIASAQ